MTALTIHPSAGTCDGYLKVPAIDAHGVMHLGCVVLFHGHLGEVSMMHRQPDVSDEDCVKFEARLSAECKARGLRKLYGECPPTLAAHYVETYHGWRIVRHVETPAGTLVRVEKWLVDTEEV